MYQGLKECPLPLCGASVIHLPRHLKNMHGWSTEHSRTAVMCFGMRKSYLLRLCKSSSKESKKNLHDTEENTKQKTKDNKKHCYCPVVGCTSLGKRIPAHLRKEHKLNSKGKEYKDLLSRVRGPVSELQMRPYQSMSLTCDHESPFQEVVTKRWHRSSTLIS